MLWFACARLKGTSQPPAATTHLNTPNLPGADTYFRIASNTKTMTAAVIMQLAQESRLSVDDKVSMYVPGVPNGDKISIAELLEMRSGLYNYTSAPEVSASIDHNPSKVWSREELLAIAFARPINFPPGIRYEYNNTNYALLGLIIEKIDRKPLAQAGEVLELLEKWEGCILTGLNVWRRSNHPNKEHPPWQEYRAARAHARG